jgi:hypothetical protein
MPPENKKDSVDKTQASFRAIANAPFPSSNEANDSLDVSKKQKASSPRKLVTTVVANIDVGWGNSLFIRGSGGTLSWEKGILMENLGADKWQWACAGGKDFAFKFLINDQIWAKGEDMTASPGTTSIHFPSF